jgi:hypothetical protein
MIYFTNLLNFVKNIRKGCSKNLQVLLAYTRCRIAITKIKKWQVDKSSKEQHRQWMLFLPSPPSAKTSSI